MKEENIDVAMLQETLTKNSEKIKIAGYNSYTNIMNNPRHFRGVVTLVKKKLKSKKIEQAIPCGENVEVLAVSVLCQTSEVVIYNIYNSPNHGELEISEVLQHASAHPAVVAGDMNTHHPRINPPGITTIDAAGRHIDVMLQEYPLVKLLNTREATHEKGAALDLMLVSSSLSSRATWRVHPHLYSDHFAVVAEVNAHTPTPPPFTPRWNTKRADWSAFQGGIRRWSQGYEPPGELEEHNNDIVEALNKAAEGSIPLTKQFKSTKSDHWYYSNRVKELKHRLNTVRTNYLKHKSNKNLELLRSTRELIAKELNTIKHEKWMEWCESINSHTNLPSLWAHLNTARGKSKSNSGCLPDPIREAEKIMLQFKNRRNSTNLPRKTINKLQELRPRRLTQVNESCAAPAVTDAPFTPAELAAVLKAGRDTAPGKDRVTHSMVKNAGPEGHEALLELYNHSLSDGKLPSAWKKSITIPVPKPDGTYRPIELLPCVGKTMEKMIKNRIEHQIGPLNPNLFAYQKGKGTQQALASIHNLLHKPNAQVITIDLEKAFELCNSDVILHLLSKKGIKGRLLQWVKDFLQGRTSQVLLHGHLSNSRAFENGTPQGSSLSPLLFNLVMEEVLTIPHNADTYLCSFADDLTIVIVGRTAMEDARQALRLMEDKCEELGLKINVKKTEAIQIKQPQQQQQQCNNLKLQGKSIKFVDTHKILGIVLNRSLQWNAHIEHVMERIQPRLNIMRAMTSYKLGLNLNIIRTFYVACIRSIVDCAAPSLVTAPPGVIARLEKMQNQALRIMTGAPPWAKLTNLRMETNLPKIEVRIKQITASFTAQISRSEDMRPLTENILESINIVNRQGLYQQTTQPDSQLQSQQALQRPQHPPPPVPLKSWSACAARSLQAMSVSPAALRSTDDAHPGYIQPPPWEDEGIYVTLTTHKDKSSLSLEDKSRIKVLIHEASSKGNTTSYFTDGSVDPQRHTAGCAFVSSYETASFRLSNGSSTLQAELAAIMMALRHATSMAHDSTQVQIFTDSMSSIMVLTKREVQDNIHLITSIRCSIQQLKAQQRQVQFYWLPSHIDIHGNERADAAAKEALLLPRVNIHLPPSMSSLKHTIRKFSHRTIKAQHENELLQQSPSARWYSQATNLEELVVPPTMPRRLSAILHRLRLGFPCWEELRGEERPCEHCGEETLTPLLHYLLECEATQQLRSRTTTHAPPHPDPRMQAAAIARTLVEDADRHDFLCTKPPPK